MLTDKKVSEFPSNPLAVFAKNVVSPPPSYFQTAKK